MRRWKLYFRYDHLPPHLQRISRPFGEAAEAIMGSASPDEALNACRFVVAGPDGVQDAEEAGRAVQLINFAESNARGVWKQSALYKLLQAKDCAVRAHLPDPPLTGA